MTAPLLEARSVTKAYRLKTGFLARPAHHLAVDDIALTLAPRERLGVVGESGSGKSTLGRLLLGLARPTKGEVRFEDVPHALRKPGDWSAFRRKTALVQQNPLAALNPQMMIGEQVAEAVHVHRLANRAGSRDRAAAMLERVGLSSAMMNRFPHQMSGGQRQRVVIARSLILDPKVVVFDEAVSALDVSVQAQVVALLRSLWQERELAYVFITHDLRIVRHLVDRIAVMYLGRVVETGDIGSVYANALHPYTRALLASVPTLDPKVRHVAPPIKGELDPNKIGPGCAFRSRCPAAVDRCAGEAPRLRTVGGRDVACHNAEQFLPAPVRLLELAP